MSDKDLYRFERCKDPADKDRCQAIGKGGQCPFKAVEGTRHCPRHGGVFQQKAIQRDVNRLYLIAQYQAKYERQADHPHLKSLRDELALLRMTLETKIQLCKDDTELMMRSGAITEMVREITKTAVACHKLEMSLNVVLDKTQAMSWVTEIGQILARYISDSDILAFVAEDLVESLDRRLQSNPLKPMKDEHEQD